MSRSLIVAPALVLTTVSACATEPAAPAASAAAATAPDPRGPSHAAAMNEYRATVLPTGTVLALNNSGGILLQMPGGSTGYYSQGTTRAVALPAGAVTVEPRGLADDGRIIGQAYGSFGEKAVLYENAWAAPVEFMAPFPATAQAISPTGVIAGRYQIDGKWRNFRWTRNGGRLDITPLRAYIYSAYLIARDDYIFGAGQSYRYPEPHPQLNEPTNFRWSPGLASGVAFSWSLNLIQALPGGAVLAENRSLGSVIWTPAGTTPVGPSPLTMPVTNINASGRMVGTLQDAATGKTLGWTSVGNGPVTVLPLPSGYASVSGRLYVNDCGTIAGMVRAAEGTSSRGAVWNRPLAVCESVGTAP